MADPYIDQFETLIYGQFARDQMKEVCIGRIPALDATVQYAIAEQTRADAEMKEVLDKQPRAEPAIHSADVLEEARDVIVRFGSYLDSLKGRPVNPKHFFRHEAPSVVARRRLTKLSAAITHIIAELPRHEEHIRDKAWLDDFTAAHQKLVALERQQRSAKVDKADIGPEVAAARERWLDTYNANKLLIRGLLGHAGKPELLPLIFDDLAEFHRVAGVSDEPQPTPSGVSPKPTPTTTTPQGTTPQGGTPATTTPQGTTPTSPAPQGGTPSATTPQTGTPSANKP